MYRARLRSVLESLLGDLRYGLRILLKRPGFAVVAVLVIALGVGANAAVFSAVNAFLLRPLPVRDVDRLVLPLPMQGADPFGVSAIDYERWKESGLTSFESMAVGLLRSYNVTGDGDPERVVATSLAPDFLPTLGVLPALGRNFTDAEARGALTAPVAILAHGLWQRRYGSDPNILGRSIRLEGRDHAIIGVMPPGYDLPLRTQLWTPYSLDSVAANSRAVRQHIVVARLRGGVSLEQAEQELQGVARALEREQPTTHAGWSLKLLPLRQGLLDDVEGRVRAGLFALLSAVGFLLLIACATLANLLLGRSLDRVHEIAVRVSLGADRARLVQQLLTESAVLLIAGSLGGILVAAWVAPLVLRFSPIRTSAFADHLFAVSFDGRVMGFSLAVTLLTGLLFGLIPALRVARADLAASIKEKTARGSLGPGTRRLMDGSVVAQVALTLVLLVSAGVMLRSFGRLQQLALGFRPAGVMTMELNLPAQQYPALGQRLAFVEDLLERVRALPGVRSAGVTTNTPLSHFTFDSVYQCEGRPAATASEVLLTADRLVIPGYLETIGVTVLKGRPITSQDTLQTQPVVVVSEELARTCWPGTNPIGRRVRRISRLLPQAPWMVVVGLVQDVREDRTAFRRARAVWYVPFAQTDLRRSIHLAVLSHGDPFRLTAPIRRELRAIDPHQPVSEAVLLSADSAELVSPDRFAAFVVLAFALAGLFLAVLGIFGLVRYVTGQRTREFGIRMAFGARRSDIQRLVLRQGMRLASAGVLLGAVGAVAISRVLSRFVFDAADLPVLTVTGVALLLVGVTLLACLVPARRAARVDPMVALRCE